MHRCLICYGLNKAGFRLRFANTLTIRAFFKGRTKLHSTNEKGHPKVPFPEGFYSAISSYSTSGIQPGAACARRRKLPAT